MLQVSFRNRKYKNWLQKAIQWYAKQDSINIDANKYIQFLDTCILERYNALETGLNNSFIAIPAETQLNRNNSMSLGVNTPHFLLNFIDYLSLVANNNTIKHQIHHSEKIQTF